ncbi:Site-specific recombinase XerD [Vibrio chagasii]|nr:Site-specific recombinase XerD [Vibrio chagasii]
MKYCFYIQLNGGIYVMTVRNLKDGNKKPWIMEAYPNGRTGKRIRKRFATKGEAMAYERFLLNEIVDKPWLGGKTDKRTLSELIELWYTLHGKYLKSGEHTRKRLHTICKALLDPVAAHFSQTDFFHYRATRINISYKSANHGKELKASSHNYDQQCLQSMFSHLIEIGELKYPNPMKGLKKLRKEESELVYLTQKEIEHLFQFVKDAKDAEQLIQIFKICLSTGARIMEAAELKGSQISPSMITFINTKGKRNRTVPISKELYEEIYKPTSGRLFHYSYPSIYNWLTKALPNLPDGQATHVLRHTFASHFMMNGGNILILQRILGHQKIEHTMNYAHFSPDHLSEAVLLNPLVFSRVEN